MPFIREKIDHDCPWMVHPRTGRNVLRCFYGPKAYISRTNGRYVQASDEGNGPLIARGEAAGPWETFEILTNRSDGTISWVSFANHKLVTAENAGESALIARATEIQDWEKFKFHSLTLDGQRGLAFYAVINNNYVMADNNGADPLIARTWWDASYWEQFFNVEVPIR